MSDLTEYSLDEALVAERAAREQAEDDLRFIRDEWSPFSARACPACVYVDGKFIRHCKVHEWSKKEIKSLYQLNKNLRDRIEQILSTCAHIGVEMSYDGYGRNALAESLTEQIAEMALKAANSKAK